MAINFQNSFNARNLDPKEIAETFIFSPSFDILKNQSHTVILGARGCGKTTLMKMLTLPALHNWKNKIAEKFREDIPFYAVYIPTDISWLYKDIAIHETRIDNQLIELISKFSVTTNIFESLCDTLLNVLTYEIHINEQSALIDIEFCFGLIDFLKLGNNTVPQLTSIKESLKLRRNVINENLSKVIYNKNYEFENFDFLHLNYVDTIPLIIDLFERIYKPKKKFWALCFDELEFAPTWLKKQLYRLLRSTDQRILFKLSSSPILPKEVDEVLKDESGATPGNDFDIIKMWEIHAQSNNEFAKELIIRLLQKRKISIKPKDYFGSNYRFLEGQESYTSDSDYIIQIKELASKDISFKEYLLSKNIDPDNPIPTDKKQLSSVFRKIKPVVYYRNYFIKENNKSKITLNTNKKFIELYSGYEILSSITDGNPRWLIGLINSILDRSDTIKADANVQFDEILKTSNRFSNFINNTPYNNDKYKLNMEEFIIRIGRFFENALLNKNFDSEPYSTFIYDPENIELTDIIEKGLLQGAFILVNENQESFDFDLKNKRFKLSYLYSPQFKLPLRVNKGIKLDKIISDNTNTTMPNLFNYDEN
ncbi:ORC-CDC6 family AAA ATPase [Chryseobacterium sp. 22543]|uniref:ORC-CDC6 family AAA ATPase n=1 Tax=Chryseobacterium sp. 22543 TaxID=3453940 RepID=UPI003F853F60